MSSLSDPRLVGAEVHWVVKATYAWLLRGHPAIHKVWEIDEGISAFAWLKLCRTWANTEKFDLVLDLHANLRTRIARWIFWQRENFSGNLNWISLKKDRIRRIAYFFLKSIVPPVFRPIHALDSISGILDAGLGPAVERSGHRPMPRLAHLERGAAGIAVPHAHPRTVGLVPASRWKNKEWPAERFVELAKILAKNHGIELRVIGRSAESAVRDLGEKLSKAGVAGGQEQTENPNLVECLRSVDFLVSVDTGIAHVAQALGIPTLILFGPTASDQGFGPWGPKAISAETDLWCRPCGKDGRFCYRPIRKAKCLTDLDSEFVVKRLVESGLIPGKRERPE
ncbi:MAG: glycosyltransferase family 9 protein [Bdellovibrionota bacterium]